MKEQIPKAARRWRKEITIPAGGGETGPKAAKQRPRAPEGKLRETTARWEEGEALRVRRARSITS